MPELPEVETIARNLRLGTNEYHALIGETISSGVVLWEKTLAYPSIPEFSKNITGQQIEAITRRGKYLVILLVDTTLLFHLRMSGDLLVEPAEESIPLHHRLILNFVSGRRLAFNDPRKFGRAWLTPQPEMFLGALGPEPLDERFTAADFFQRLHQKHRQLKALQLAFHEHLRLLRTGVLLVITVEMFRSRLKKEEAIHPTLNYPTGFS